MIADIDDDGRMSLNGSRDVGRTPNSSNNLRIAAALGIAEN